MRNSGVGLGEHLPVVLRFEDGKIGTRSGWLATELKSPVKLLLLASSDMLESTLIQVRSLLQPLHSNSPVRSIFLWQQNGEVDRNCGFAFPLRHDQSSYDTFNHWQIGPASRSCGIS